MINAPIHRVPSEDIQPALDHAEPRLYPGMVSNYERARRRASITLKRRNADQPNGGQPEEDLQSSTGSLARTDTL